MSRAFRAISKLGGFATTVAINAAVSLATIPAVISETGEQGWASIAVGQSLGAVLSIFTLLGWALTGPIDVVRAKASEVGEVYATSLYVRAIALVVMTPVAFTATSLMGTSAPVATGLTAVAMLLIGTGPTWFYVGESRPMRLLVFDTLPRALAILVATGLLLSGSSIVTYSVVVACGGIASVAFASMDILSRHRPSGFRPLGPSGVARVLHRQRHGIGTAVLSTTYLSAPVLLVQLISPTVVPVFALADKLKQQALTAYRPIGQVIQGWTPRGEEARLIERVTSVGKAAIAMAFVGASALAVAIGPISGALGGGQVDAGGWIAIPIGIAFGAGILSTTTGLACLVPLGLQRHVTMSAAIGTGVMLASVVPLTLAAGAVGAATAVAGGQCGVATYQTMVLWRRLRAR